MNTVSAIYKISNPLDNKIYIGGSKNIKLRFADHKKRLRLGKHRNKNMQDIYDANGHVFIYEILAIVRKEDVLLYEQKAIDVYKPELNICKDVRGFGEKENNPYFQKRGMNSHNFGIKRPDQSARASAQTGDKNPMFGKKNPKVAASNRRRSEYWGA